MTLEEYNNFIEYINKQRCVGNIEGIEYSFTARILRLKMDFIYSFLIPKIPRDSYIVPNRDKSGPASLIIVFQVQDIPSWVKQQIIS